MPTQVRVRRINVDASPNQFATTPDPARPLGLKEFTCNNPTANGDVYLSFYEETSGNIAIGTTAPVYGPKKVTAGGELTLGGDDYASPLASFTNAITVTVTTTADGSTSPTSDCSLEIQYWRF